MAPSVSNLAHPCLKQTHHMDNSHYSHSCSRSYSHDFNYIISRESGHRRSYHRELSPLQDNDSHALSHKKSTEFLPERYRKQLKSEYDSNHSSTWKDLAKDQEHNGPSLPSMMVQNQWNTIYDVWYKLEFVIDLTTPWKYIAINSRTKNCPQRNVRKKEQTEDEYCPWWSKTWIEIYQPNPLTIIPVIFDINLTQVTNLKSIISVAEHHCNVCKI